MKKMDDDERKILEAYEKGELVSTTPSKQAIDDFKAAARATFAKDQRVNIRLSSLDLITIQSRAMEDGIPYHTLIASILHKYATGRLVEKPARPNMRSRKSSREQPTG